MDVPQRNTDLRRLDYNRQTNESEHYRVPGRIPSYKQSYPSSQVPSSTKIQLQRSASNQVRTQSPGNMHRSAPIPFSDSSASGCTNGGNVPRSAACVPQRYTFKNDVSREADGSGNTGTNLPDCTTTLRSVYCADLPDSGNYGQQGDDEVFARPSSRVEGARGFRAVDAHNKVPGVGSATGFQKASLGEKSSNSLNYINPKLVQKVLDCQKKRAQTPVNLLSIYNKEVPLSAAGRRTTRLERPEHHSSDTSLCNRVADCRIADPETVSTGSQKESGYHSGDSVGDRLSENSEQGHAMRGVTVTEPFPTTPDDVCEHYFLKGDSLMDLCSEQERSGNFQQALHFLSQAIDCFQQATSVPGVSHDNVLRMRLKHNRAVLHRRKLLKQSGFSAEVTARRLPCTPQEVNEMSMADTHSKYRQPMCDQSHKVPIGLDCRDGTGNRDMGFDRKPPLHPKSRTGNVDFAVGGNSENVSLGVGDPDLPETAQQWTSDDVKDIKIYATLPKNRRRNNGPLVTDAPIINPVEAKLRSEISISCRNEEVSRQPSETRNGGGQRAVDCHLYQQGPNHYYRDREPVPERLQVKGNSVVPERTRPVPCTDVPRLHESVSHYFRSDDVNVRRKDESTSNQNIKFARF